MRKLDCFPWSTNDSVGHQITAECESGNGLVYKLLTPPFYLLASSNLMRSLFDTLCKVMPAQLEFCMRCYSMRWGQLNFFQFLLPKLATKQKESSSKLGAESCHVCIPLSVAGSHSIWPFVKVAVTEKSFDTQRGSSLSSFDVLSQTRMPKKED